MDSNCSPDIHFTHSRSSSSPPHEVHACDVYDNRLMRRISQAGPVVPPKTPRKFCSLDVLYPMTAKTIAPGFGTVDTDTVLERLDQFAYWTDECISVPGLKARIGLDPLIGLIPVWGDAIGGIISCYVPYEAYRAGAPPSLIVKMLAVIVAEALVGAVPLIGDLIDMVVKSNRINVRLLEDYLTA